MSPRSGTTPAAPHSRSGRRLTGALAVLLALVLSLALPALMAGPASAAAKGTGEVYVIHGITGQTLDIWVDGKKVLAAAKPKTIVGPLTLDAGSHQVTLRKGSKTVATGRFKLGAGQSVDVVAHLMSDSSMGDAVTAYRNDTSAVGPGKLRLAVAHVAAAPPADIKVNDTVLFSNVANGESLTVLVPSATYKVEIDPAATSGKAILGPVELKLKKGTLTRVYAIGNVATGSMDAVVHVLPVKTSGAGAPSSVPTGNGGQTATQFVTSRFGVTEVMMAGALALLCAAGFVVVSGRRQRMRDHIAL